MGKVRTRPETGRLYFDFHLQGVRYREHSALPDTPANRRRMEKALERIEAEIAAGTFDYAKTFPGSKRAANVAPRPPVGLPPPPTTLRSNLPRFDAFAEQWFAERGIEWRHSHKLAVESIFKVHLMPTFATLQLDEIDRARVMDFRRKLMDPTEKKLRRRGILAPATVNRVIGTLRLILAEASLRFGITNPCVEIRRLKPKRTDIHPFTLEEIHRILKNVRPDYRPYVTFRFFTGVRSAEAQSGCSCTSGRRPASRPASSPAISGNWSNRSSRSSSMRCAGWRARAWRALTPMPPACVARSRPMPASPRPDHPPVRTGGAWDRWRDGRAGSSGAANGP